MPGHCELRDVDLLLSDLHVGHVYRRRFGKKGMEILSFTFEGAYSQNEENRREASNPGELGDFVRPLRHFFIRDDVGRQQKRGEQHRVV